MASALTVETGDGVTGADSYIATSAITTYGTNHGISTTLWEAATDAQTDAWARNAARVLDSRWRRKFPGRKRLSTQGLRWPRTDAYDAEDHYLASDEVPDQIPDAQAHLALLASNGTSIAADSDSGAPIVEVRGASGAGVKFASPLSVQQFREVNYILEPLLVSAVKWTKAPNYALKV